MAKRRPRQTEHDNPSPFGSCKSCGAVVRWAKTVKGNNIPLDPTSTNDGNMILLNGIAYVVSANYKKEHPDESFYVTHFATCPNAKRHRKEKKG